MNPLYIRIILASIAITIATIVISLTITLTIIVIKNQHSTDIELDVENKTVWEIPYWTYIKNETVQRQLTVEVQKFTDFWFYNITKISKYCKDNNTDFWNSTNDINEWNAVMNRMKHEFGNDSIIWLNGKTTPDDFNNEIRILTGIGHDSEWHKPNQSSYVDLTFKFDNNCVYFDPMDSEHYKLINCTDNLFFTICKIH